MAPPLISRTRTQSSISYQSLGVEASFLHPLSPLAERSCPLSLFNAACLPGWCHGSSSPRALTILLLLPRSPPWTRPSLRGPGGPGRLQTIGMGTGLSGGPAGVTAKPHHHPTPSWVQPHFTLGVQACITVLARSLVCSY